MTYDAKARELMESLLNEDVYKYSSTQVNLPQAHADFLIKWGRSMIKDDDLYYDEKGEMGRENEAHITVLYGITDDQPSKELKELLGRTKPFTARLTSISLFDDNEDYDVVKFDVQSKELVDLANALRQVCPNENKFPKYIPHATIAYVKKGRATDLAGMMPFENDSVPIPDEFDVNEIMFKGSGDSDKVKRVIARLQLNRYTKESENPKRVFKKAVSQRNPEETLLALGFKRGSPARYTDAVWHRDKDRVRVTVERHQGVEPYYLVHGAFLWTNPAIRPEGYVHNRRWHPQVSGLHTVIDEVDSEVRTAYGDVLRAAAARGRGERLEAEDPKRVFKNLTELYVIYHHDAGNTRYVKLNEPNAQGGFKSFEWVSDRHGATKFEGRDTAEAWANTLYPDPHRKQYQVKVGSLNRLLKVHPEIKEAETPKSVFKLAKQAANAYYVTRNADAYGKPIETHYLKIVNDAPSWVTNFAVATVFKTAFGAEQAFEKYFGGAASEWQGEIGYTPRKALGPRYEAEDPKSVLKKVRAKHQAPYTCGKCGKPTKNFLTRGGEKRGCCPTCYREGFLSVMGEAESPRKATQIPRIHAPMKFRAVPEGHYFRTPTYALVRKQSGFDEGRYNAVTTDLDTVRGIKFPDDYWVAPPDWTINDITSKGQTRYEAEGPKGVFRSLPREKPWAYVYSVDDDDRFHKATYTFEGDPRGFSERNANWGDDLKFKVYAQKWVDKFNYLQARHPYHPAKWDTVWNWFGAWGNQDYSTNEAEDPRNVLRKAGAVKSSKRIAVRWADQWGGPHITTFGYPVTTAEQAIAHLKVNLAAQAHYQCLQVLDTWEEPLGEAEDPKKVFKQVTCGSAEARLRDLINTDHARFASVNVAANNDFYLSIETMSGHVEMDIGPFRRDQLELFRKEWYSFGNATWEGWAKAMKEAGFAESRSPFDLLKFPTDASVLAAKLLELDEPKLTLG